MSSREIKAGDVCLRRVNAENMYDLCIVTKVHMKGVYNILFKVS